MEERGSGGCGRRTTAEGAAGQVGRPGVRGCVACLSRLRPGWFGRLARPPGVRGCVACRRRPGPSKSREELQPWASLFTSRTMAGRAEDRRGGGDEHGSQGLRPGET